MFKFVSAALAAAFMLGIGSAAAQTDPCVAGQDGIKSSINSFLAGAAYAPDTRPRIWNSQYVGDMPDGEEICSVAVGTYRGNTTGQAYYWPKTHQWTFETDDQVATDVIRAHIRPYLAAWQAKGVPHPEYFAIEFLMGQTDDIRATSTVKAQMSSIADAFAPTYMPVPYAGSNSYGGVYNPSPGTVDTLNRIRQSTGGYLPN